LGVPQAHFYFNCLHASLFYTQPLNQMCLRRVCLNLNLLYRCYYFVILCGIDALIGAGCNCYLLCAKIVRCTL
jgi:hypothetical protein